MSQCSALKLSEQLIQFSSKLICRRATFSCPFTPFSYFINLIAHSLISTRLSPSLVPWPIPEGSVVKVSQPISVQLMYCPLPDTTSIVSRQTSPPCSGAAGQSEVGWCFGKGWMGRWLWSQLYLSVKPLVSNPSTSRSSSHWRWNQIWAVPPDMFWWEILEDLSWETNTNNTFSCSGTKRSIHFTF